MIGCNRVCASLGSRFASSNFRISSLHRVRTNCVSSFKVPGILRIPRASFHQLNGLRQTADANSGAEAEVNGATNEEFITRFKELETRGIVHKTVVETLTDRMRLKTMTEVQSKTINEALSGVDVIAQAKTGTGKTIAFLLPIVQRILRDQPELADGGSRTRSSSNDSRALIVSPTRELAEQIAEEARRLTSLTGIKVQTAVGGTQKREALSLMQRQGCHILVGTPGRLADILEDPNSRVSLPKLQTLVYDEADRLLDAGFAGELDVIKSHTPKESDDTMQTLFFSATIPKEVVHLVRSNLRKGFRFVKCVRDDEQPTHERVPQKAIVTRGMENMMPALYELCHREIKNARVPGSRPFKAIIFFNMNAEVMITRQVLDSLSNGKIRDHPLKPAKVFHMSSRLTQAQRTFTTQMFRKAESAILLSSDVTARGMDFPDVTHVIQYGLPRGRDQYVHRLGRTARAGKEGEGWLIVNRDNARELASTFGEFPIEEDSSIITARIDLTAESEIPEESAKYIKDVLAGFSRVEKFDLEDLYRLLLATNSTVPKPKMVQVMNDLARCGWGLDQLPSVTRQWAGKVGYGNTHGLNMSEGDRSYRRQPGFDNDRRGQMRRGQYGADPERDAFEDMGFGNNRTSRGSFSPRSASPRFSEPRRGFGARERY